MAKAKIVNDGAIYLQEGGGRETTDCGEIMAPYISMANSIFKIYGAIYY